MSHSEPRPSGDEASSLRGPVPAEVGRRFWLVASGIVLLVFATVIVASFVSTANSNARIDRLKLHGIPVTVTVAGCFGNLGGSGSNVSSYTCHGRYVVRGVHYEQVIGSLSSFTRAGTTVRGIVDPSRVDSVVLAKAVRTSSASSGAYVIEGILSLVFVGLTLAFVRVARRAPSRRSPSVERV